MTEEEKKAKSKARAAAWREANREITRAKARNPEKLRLKAEESRKWYAANREEVSQKRKVRRKQMGSRYSTEKQKKKHCEEAKDYYARHREKAKARQRKYYSENRDQAAETMRLWREKNKDQVRAKILEWQRNNRTKMAMYQRRRRTLKLNSLHPELDREKEEALAHECRQVTKTTGIDHQIDHIIPLVFGGWHHHDNLQILPRSLNAQKNDNPVWEMKGYKCWRDVPEYLWPEKLRSIYARMLI